MAAAAPLDFNGFLGQIAALGTVNTDGNGFIAAMALVEFISENYFIEITYALR